VDPLATAGRVVSLAVRDVRWHVGGRTVLDGVSLDVPEGHLVGLLGPNGSGKSTLLRFIAGVPRALGGSGPTGAVTWRGADLPALRPRERARRVAFVEQDAHTELDLTVRDVVSLGRTPHRGRLGLGGGSRDVGDALAVRTALAAVGLEEMQDRRLDTLSGGERQRVHLGRGLAQDPELLLLDEPTNHLDIQAQLAVLGLVRRATDAGLTALVAIHDLNLAATYCDTVVLLADGVVAAAGPVREVLVPAVVDAVYGVRSTVHATEDGAPVLSFRTGGQQPAAEV
jgi:iron complex transport system ATP-binding protein